MRTRIGNPYREAHDKELRVYEFVADGTQTPEQICAAAEAATGLRLRGDGAGQNGYINTAMRSDGSRFVAIVLYEACEDTACPAGHGARPERGTVAVPHRRAPDLTAAQQAAVKVACREHPRHRLTNSNAAAVLRSLGFTDADAALRS